MDEHEHILAETTRILELSFDRLQDGSKDTSLSSRDSFLSKCKEAIQQLAADLQEERKRNADLEATVSQVSAQMTEREEESSDLKRRLDAMTKELEEVCVSNAELERELFKMQRENEKVAELEASLAEKSEAVKDWHKHLEVLEERFGKLEEVNKDLRLELEVATETQKDYEQQIADLQKGLKQKTQELTESRFKEKTEDSDSEKNSLIQKFKHDLTNSQEMRNHLSDTNRKLASELRELKSQLQEIESDLKIASGRIQSLEEANSELRQERTILSEAVEQLRELTQRQSREILEAARKGGQESPTQTELAEYGTRLNAEMKKRLSDKSAFRALLQKDKDAFTAKLEEKDSLIATLKGKVDTFAPIACRTSDQLASLSLQLTQEREKRLSAERALSVFFT